MTASTTGTLPDKGIKLPVRIETRTGTYLFSSDFPETPLRSFPEGQAHEALGRFLCNILASHQSLLVKINSSSEEGFSTISIAQGDPAIEIDVELLSPLIELGLYKPEQPAA